MSNILLISGSPSAHSRSDLVLRAAGNRLSHDTAYVSVQDVPAADLAGANFNSTEIQHIQRQIQEADGIIIASPVYKAAYSGVLKALLDLLPSDAFRDKPVLPLMTGGSANHLLALEYSFKPLLAALKGQTLQGVYIIDDKIDKTQPHAPITDEELSARLDRQLSELTAAIASRKVLL
ncbi:NADPH-dependent FMN reductase [Planococcus maitriensis]|uniref:FMN reductase (NADPH) n=1 Tax=Planococcus maitriensis TaxID=221799 RepID=A0A365K6S8_9BACL|nr:NADPH-dependent FMN reductase [Planococcus maitriensis]RAZ68346.1 FMN reductase (NADPH) [Planococcus maitriensis]